MQAGGMERVMNEIAWHISSKPAIEVHMVLYGLSREIFYSLPPIVFAHKPKFTFNNKFRLVSSVRTLAYLRQEIRTIDPNTILSFGEYWNSFVLLALFGLKYPVYVSDRNQPDKSLGKFHDCLRRRLYPRVQGVIAQTSEAKEIYHLLYAHKNIVVIGNPIRKVKGEPAQRKNQVLMVGRLISTKHQDRLIRIFLGIDEPGWKLVLVGYDHLKQQHSSKLIELINELNGQDRVILAGKQEDVDKFYLESKVFAFTSSSEGFPNAVGEAMSAGLPVVAYDCIAGPSELIKDGYNGYLIPLFDDELFGQRLSELMKDDQQRIEMGSNAERSIKKFDKEAICEQFWHFITGN
jgi:glycosyltransferase involved in cell wall biosynthesis